jgi:hypothetical protein
MEQFSQENDLTAKIYLHYKRKFVRVMAGVEPNPTFINAITLYNVREYYGY